MTSLRAMWGGFLVALLLAGCGDTVQRQEPVRPVRAIQVGDAQAIQNREFPGRAKAKDEVDLSFQVAGPLITLSVDVGSSVKKGDVIAAIDPRDFQTALDTARGNLERAQANLLAMQRGARPEELEQLKAAVAEAQALHDQAVAEHDRNARLIKSGAATQSEFDVSFARSQSTAAKLKETQEALNIGQAGARAEDIEAKRSEIRALEAAVANAQNQLDYCVLAAPFDGEVAARYVDNFQTVQAKQPIIRVLDVTTIEITVQIPETLISLVPQVQHAVCRFDAFGDREFSGQVTKIGSEASHTTRTYPVTVELAQPEDVKILPGMAAIVRGQIEDQSAPKQLVIPSGALFAGEAGQKSYVWVLNRAEKSTVQRRAVDLGPLTAVGQVITAGLQPGEWVVAAGVNSLRENQAVTVLAEGSP